MPLTNAQKQARYRAKRDQKLKDMENEVAELRAKATTPMGEVFTSPVPLTRSLRPQPIHMTAAEFLKHRKLLGWSQRDTADALGLSIQQVRAIEHERSRITLTVKKLFSLYRQGDKPNEPKML